MRYKIDSGNSTRINITGRRTGERPGCVRIFHKGQLSEEAYYKFSGFETFLFTWEKIRNMSWRSVNWRFP